MAHIIVLQKMEKFDIEVRVVDMLRTVFDPEIPVNVYDLGLIYKVDVQEAPESQDAPDASEAQAATGIAHTFTVSIDMTLTAPNCPAADFIIEDIQQKVQSIQGVSKVNVELVFEPEWNKDMMSEEAKLDLGFM